MIHAENHWAKVRTAYKLVSHVSKLYPPPSCVGVRQCTHARAGLPHSCTRFISTNARGFIYRNSSSGTAPEAKEFRPSLKGSPYFEERDLRPRAYTWRDSTCVSLKDMRATYRICYFTSAPRRMCLRNKNVRYVPNWEMQNLLEIQGF